MYLIVVRVRENRVLVEGHANYAEPGRDIVCAGVSTLAQTLISSIEELTNDKIEVVLKSGFIKIDYKNLSKKAQTLVDSFFVGVEMIANEYPEYVRIM